MSGGPLPLSCSARTLTIGHVEPSLFCLMYDELLSSGRNTISWLSAHEHLWALVSVAITNKNWRRMFVVSDSPNDEYVQSCLPTGVGDVCAPFLGSAQVNLNVRLFEVCGFRKTNCAPSPTRRPNLPPNASLSLLGAPFSRRLRSGKLRARLPGL